MLLSDNSGVVYISKDSHVFNDMLKIDIPSSVAATILVDDRIFISLTLLERMVELSSL